MEGNCMDDSEDVDYDQLKFQFEELKQKYEQLLSESRGKSNALLTAGCQQQNLHTSDSGSLALTCQGEDLDEGYVNQDSNSFEDNLGRFSDPLSCLNPPRIKKETMDLDFDQIESAMHDEENVIVHDNNDYKDEAETLTDEDFSAQFSPASTSTADSDDHHLSKKVVLPTPDGYHACPTCGKLFDIVKKHHGGEVRDIGRDKLRFHVKLCGKRCILCPETFATFYKFTQHAQKRHGSKCSKVNELEKLLTPIGNPREMLVFNSSVMESDDDENDDHQKVIFPKPDGYHACPTCGKLFVIDNRVYGRKSADYGRVKMRHHTKVCGKRPRCSPCEETFKDLAQFARHAKQLHGNEYTKITEFEQFLVPTEHRQNVPMLAHHSCPTCGKQFDIVEKRHGGQMKDIGRVKLRFHVKVCGKMCILCLETFMTFLQFTQHAKKRHGSKCTKVYELEKLLAPIGNPQKMLVFNSGVMEKDDDENDVHDDSTATGDPLDPLETSTSELESSRVHLNDGEEESIDDEVSSAVKDEFSSEDGLDEPLANQVSKYQNVFQTSAPSRESFLNDELVQPQLENTFVDEPMGDKPSQHESLVDDLLLDGPSMDDISMDDPSTKTRAMNDEVIKPQPSASPKPNYPSEYTSEKSKEDLPVRNKTSSLSIRHNCHMCLKKSYSDISTLRKHVKVCGKRCKLCHYSASNSSDFRFHALIKHKYLHWMSLMEPFVESSTSTVFAPNPHGAKPCSDSINDSGIMISSNESSNEEVANTVKEYPASKISDQSRQPTSLPAMSDKVLDMNCVSGKDRIMNRTKKEENRADKKVCIHCLKTFMHDRSYMDHFMVCGKVCSICLKHYSQASTFQYHAMRDHKRIDWQSLLKLGSTEKKRGRLSTCSNSDDRTQEHQTHTSTPEKFHKNNFSTKSNSSDYSRFNSSTCQSAPEARAAVEEVSISIHDSSDESLGALRSAGQQNSTAEPAHFYCPKCPEIFDSGMSAFRHDRLKHWFECHCGDKMSSKKALRKHKDFHAFVKKSFKTDESVYSYPRSVKFTRADGVDCFKCHLCGKSSSRIDSFHDHLATHSSVKPYQCVVCEASFFTMKIAIKHHRYSHLLEKKHLCSICGKKFVTEQLLKTHIADIHPTERSHQCPECGACFKKAGSLQGHMVRHTDILPHECNKCGKKFKRNGDLNVHLKNSHTEGTKLRCELCSGLFKNITSLKNHQRVSHSNKLYDCSLCGKSFPYQRSRDRHKEMHAIWDANKTSQTHPLPFATSSTVDPKFPDSLNVAKKGSSDSKTCSFCQKTFTAKHIYTGHVKVCGKSCSVCHKRFEHPHNFRSHASKVHEISDWESLLQTS